MKLSKDDKNLLKSKGISQDLFEKQLAQLERGFPALNIVAPATLKKGIHSYTEEETKAFVAEFKEGIKEDNVMKFVPASGAATRMFKSLFEFREKYKNTAEDYLAFYADTRKDSVRTFFETIHEYPFVGELKKIVFAKENKSLETLIEEHEYIRVLDLLLTDEGLNLGFLPKALINFHSYDKSVRTPVREHLVAASFLFEGFSKYQVHFTIPEDALQQFEGEVKQGLEKIKEQSSAEVKVSYSFQKSSTDTVAVSRSNEPIRDEKGQMVFRPGGHGALIYNLNEVDADVVFIKNIDNVVPDSRKDKNILYEQLLGGVLLDYQKKIFKYLEKLDDAPSQKMLGTIKKFVREDLCYDFEEQENLSEQLRDILNRPLRVCGMVVNEGEPGGGPFLVKDKKGNTSLQILESSQIDLKDEEQYAIFEKATHFNPVDIVCGTKDYKGNAFDLLEYVDEEAGFTTEKSLKGPKIKALELPGLWNGAMAKWNTIFVEVPDFTFNPVKTVFDLLRPQHRR